MNDPTVFRRDCLKPNCATTLFNQRDSAISGFAYTVPGSLSPGQQVTVVNKDSVEHTVYATADANNAFDVEVTGGASATFTVPDTPGTYAFHCTYHPKMHGSLTVQ